MNYSLPTIHSDGEGFSSLANLAKAIKESSSNGLRLDFSRCHFFDANMSAALAVVLRQIADEKNVQIRNVNPALETILRKNHFLVSYGFGSLVDSKRTTLPFEHLRLSDTRLFATYLSSHMNGKGIPQMSEPLEKAFRKSIFEIFQNCVTHSESTSGIFVCGQYYPQMHRLDLTISDAGVGIRTNVRRYLQDNKVSSVAAIRWALQEGNTTKTGNEPGGMGLKLFKDFVEMNGGKIQIASRLGFYEFVGGRESFTKLNADFPGTTINLEINTNDRQSYRLSSEAHTNNVF